MLVFDHSPRRAFSKLSDKTKAEWQARYCHDDGAAARVWALLVKSESEIRSQGLPTTIHTLWMKLADRAAKDDNNDTKAAAALAGMALGLKMPS